ncbi:hypothetical protein P154DRAFT_334153 [Amniculicola lignicola CBS 123094]|uniref:Uncharacterized protein n=1 Tax=Amniculicola lignicola CBS 123094 TaxID=1392246 RepID=A0A6A5W1U7_9PLEO|nr:hypothetical protein P154DRAFT_334153 [Amniculicola lignicola CBS 123094]
MASVGHWKATWYGRNWAHMQFSRLCYWFPTLAKFYVEYHFKLQKREQYEHDWKKAVRNGNQSDEEEAEKNLAKWHAEFRHFGGMVDDKRATMFNWGFDPADIVGAKIIMYYGRRDTNTPREGSKAPMASLRNAKLTFKKCEGEDHASVQARYSYEFFRALKRAGRRR